MARDINNTVLTGRLGQAPELRYTAQNTAVCTLSVAVSESWTNKSSGELEERANWIDVECFGKNAENANQYLTKGQEVQIVGKLRQDRWEAQDGSNRSKVKVIADIVKYGPKPQQSGSQQGQQSAPAQGTNEVDESDTPF